MLLVGACERAESDNGLFDAFAAPPPVGEPQRMVRMMRARRPGGVNKRGMEILLDVIDDPVHVSRHRIFGTSDSPLNQSCLVTPVTDSIVCGCYAARQRKVAHEIS